MDESLDAILNGLSSIKLDNIQEDYNYPSVQPNNYIKEKAGESNNSQIELLLDIDSEKKNKIQKVLTVNPEEYYQQNIENRLTQSKRFTTFDNYVYSTELFKYLFSQSEGKALWVGGGRAWNKALEPTNLLEKASTLNGNWDIFSIFNSDQDEKTFICNTSSLINDFIKDFNRMYVDDGYYVKLTFKKLKISDCKNDALSDVKGRCTIFRRCHSFGIVLGRYISSNRKTIQTEKEDELFIYIESAVIKSVETDSFNNYFLSYKDSIPYLNKYGLYIVSKLISESRDEEKGLNIDDIRGVMFQRSTNVDDIKNALDKYTDIFLKSYMVAENVIADITIDIYKRYDYNIIDRAEITLMNVFREHCNALIHRINSRLTASNLGFLVIVGGDAFRRYIPSIETKDIDCKLIYNKKSSYSAVKKIVIDEMSTFTILITRMFNNFKSSLDDTDITLNSVTFNHNSQKGYIKKSPISMRIRAKDDIIPVELISLDYKYYLQITKNIRKSFTLPVLDITLNQIPNAKIEDFANENGDLLFYKLEKLIDDVYDTYNKINNNRIKNNKAQKDYNRFVKALNVPKTLDLENVESLNYYNKDTLRYFTDFKGDVDDFLINSYRKKIVKMKKLRFVYGVYDDKVYFDSLSDYVKSFEDVTDTVYIDDMDDEYDSSADGINLSGEEKDVDEISLLFENARLNGKDTDVDEISLLFENTRLNGKKIKNPKRNINNLSIQTKQSNSEIGYLESDIDMHPIDKPIEGEITNITRMNVNISMKDVILDLQKRGQIYDDDLPFVPYILEQINQTSPELFIESDFMRYLRRFRSEDVYDTINNLTKTTKYGKTILKKSQRRMPYERN